VAVEYGLFPVFVEKARVHDPPGPARPGRLTQIDDGEIGQLRRLQRIRAVSLLAKIDPAVEDHVARRGAQRIGKD